MGQPWRRAGGPLHALHGAHELPRHAGALLGLLNGLFSRRAGPGRLARHLTCRPLFPSFVRVVQASIMGKARAKEKAIARITVMRNK